MAGKTYKSARIRGKKRVCVMLSASSRLKRHVPRTLRLTEANLSGMLASRGSVYIKPDVGSLGIGISKAIVTTRGFRLIRIKNNKQYSSHYSSIDKLYRDVTRSSKGRMIVQQAIPLATVHGRPYDIRMMVQRKPRGNWTVTGSFARVARKHKIVTNYSQGGRVRPLVQLHRACGFSVARHHRRNGQLKRIALLTANWLGSHRSGMHEIGIDFAYDRGGKLWILEVNSNHPQFHPLASTDPAAYRRMMSFARSYGRFAAK